MSPFMRGFLRGLGWGNLIGGCFWVAALAALDNPFASLGLALMAAGSVVLASEGYWW